MRVACVEHCHCHCQTVQLGHLTLAPPTQSPDANETRLGVCNCMSLAPKMKALISVDAAARRSKRLNLAWKEMGPLAGLVTCKA